MAENWGFMPYSESKKQKNGGFLRVCGRKMVGGAVKKPKNPPGWLLSGGRAEWFDFFINMNLQMMGTMYVVSC